ncbi:MAG: hypothetical protein JW940_37685 [Polyangiaceae bacterium]|nr:hypothetical protein [Polyangiaceae bacterium]
MRLRTASLHSAASSTARQGATPFDPPLTRRAWLGGVAVLMLARPASAGGWEKIDEDDGIRVFRKEVPGSPLVAFRGEGMVHSPIEKILWVIADDVHRAEWTDRLEKSRVLEQRSQSESVIYQHYSMPFPVSDRDYVYYGRATRNRAGGVTIDLRSVTHPKAPPTVGVRAKLMFGRYVLLPKGPSATYVVVEMHTDPMGSIPSWLVNLVQKSWPMNTIQGLRSQVNKPFVGRVELRLAR